ncbi:MAG: BatA and WFA domain-containing protein [Sedimentisphaerales bacterium]|nr:BatA and WFA domain-containing protein [Sedimentisphaerales bacterium]
MNFLYPLFLAGIAAVALPIILHMIRRHTRKRITFSSLMFLRTSIPRFKNRTRLENLLLLILRCIIICLLAFSFSRPFFPREVPQKQVSLRKRIVLLIDTSASMRRNGIWAQAISEAKSVLKDVGEADRVCVISFDQNTKTLIGFEQWASLEPARRTTVVTEYISELSPSWDLTNLGNALVSAAEAIEDDQVEDGQQTYTMSRVVLISDLQKGSNLEAMNAYEWPEDTELVVKAIQCQGNTNAALQLVTDRSGSGNTDDDNLPGIRITNSSDATTERFQLNWADKMADETSSKGIDVYAPPGHSVVVRAPAREDRLQARKLILTGDDHDFDNTLFLAPYLQQQVNILYIGNEDPNDSKEMLYYVKRAFGTTRALKPNVIYYPGDKDIAATDIETAHLVIAADKINSENLAHLRQYLESGQTILLVMKSTDDVTTLTGLSGIESIESEEANVDRYAMLGRIEFKHPLLMPFSDPRFGDFTQIHIWKYRKINNEDLPNAQVLANFDSGDPAWLELTIGKGTLLIFTCGWHPSDSQLALSSKFVPLFYSILEYGGVLVGRQSQYFVGDNIPITHLIKAASANIQIRKPDDSLVSLDTNKEVFNQTDMPGIYTIETSAGNHTFAVNLPVRECQTAAMQIEDIERFGVSFKQSSDIAVEQTTQAKRQRSFAGMEYEQKVWRWLLVALLVVSLIEIWLAGWLTRSPSNLSGEMK